MTLLQIPQTHEFDLQDDRSFLKLSRLRVPFNYDEMICQSLFPMNLADSIPFAVVWTS